MLLSPGSVIGPYRIIGPIGAGGMGEVYRAKDTRLAREVALKIVSARGLNKPDRQDRFEREARAASALNHPNILTIHDIGVEDGMPFIVSELVPGETLRKLASKGPLPVRTLLNLAVQIADGLAAAHERRIVHRDLKPDNIMVTPDARVKILDFGLAKAVAIAEDDSAATVTMTATEPGIVLGTVPYMSPEQARGTTVDYRSDQFAFGLILYEMASGKQAFRRDTAAQTLSAILTEEAPPMDAGLPPPLRWIIARCLAKDPSSRYAATSDLHREIACLRDNLPEVSNAIPRSALQPLRAKRQIPIAAAAAISLTAGVLATWLWLQRPTTNLASQRYTPLAAEAAAEGFPSWSTNGKTVAYSADVAGIYQIFTRSLESATPAQITRSLRDCIYPFWSPSGSRIYYISRDTARTELWSVGAAGGEPELVVADAVAAAMSTDGRTLALLRSGVPGLWISSISGTDIRRFADAPGSELGGFIRFSPDGKKLACWVGNTYSEAQFRVFPYPGGGDAGRQAGRAWDRRFLHGARPFNWMPDSQHIVFEARQPTVASYHLWISDLDGNSIQPLTASTVDEAYPAVSPDGKRIAFMVVPPDWDLVEIPVDGTPMRNLLSTPGYESWPAWSPRNEQIAYSTTRSGAFEIWLRSVRDGWDRPLVTGKDFGQEPTAYLTQSSFSPDGGRVAYTRNGGQIVLHLDFQDRGRAAGEARP
jgi:serine/threonine protein kinase